MVSAGWLKTRGLMAVLIETFEQPTSELQRAVGSGVNDFLLALRAEAQNIAEPVQQSFLFRRLGSVGMRHQRRVREQKLPVLWLKLAQRQVIAEGPPLASVCAYFLFLLLVCVKSRQEPVDHSSFGSLHFSIGPGDGN